jgi:hypothetical protein
MSEARFGLDVRRERSPPHVWYTKRKKIWRGPGVSDNACASLANDYDKKILHRAESAAFAKFFFQCIYMYMV